MIYLIMAILCIGYFFYTIPHTNRISDFQLIWLFMGSGFFLLYAFAFLNAGRIVMIPAAIVIAVRTVLILMAFLTGLGMIQIMWIGKRRAKDGADTIIVLGAHIYGKRISRSLRSRLDKAYFYFRRNSNSRLYVSGGMGEGEEVTEADAMADYLIMLGVPEGALVREDRSTNTEENIQFCMAMMDAPNAQSTGKEKRNKKIIIVTNDFHVLRSLLIAKKKGLTNVQGLGAKTQPGMLPCYLLREILALIFYRLRNRI